MQSDFEIRSLPISIASTNWENAADKEAAHKISVSALAC